MTSFLSQRAREEEEHVTSYFAMVKADLYK